jgi:lysophospholipase L1-like esterase
MKFKSVVLLLVSLIGSLLLLEATLRILTPHPITRVSNKIPHPVLGYVMDSRLPGIDRQGFRNDEAPPFSIVAIGDSHTFGFNVESRDAWPKVLGRLLNRKVYNYGIGGYGVLQYSALMDEAIRQQPEWILIGLYLANDLDDICRFVRTNSHWQAQSGTLGIDPLLCPDPDAQMAALLRKNALNRWLSEHFAAYSILSGYLTEQAIRREIEHGDSAVAVTINNNKVKALVSRARIEAHANAMDLDKPDIRQAYSVLQNFLLSANRTSRQHGIRFGVLLIPSQERVLHGYLQAHGRAPNAGYARAVANEDRLRHRLVTFMESTGVAYMDVLPWLENALHQSGPLYAIKDDGHPVAAGYRNYADAAARLIAGRN